MPTLGTAFFVQGISTAAFLTENPEKNTFLYFLSLSSLPTFLGSEPLSSIFKANTTKLSHAHVSTSLFLLFASFFFFFDNSIASGCEVLEGYIPSDSVLL